MPISLATIYAATGETSNAGTYETGIYQPRANTLLLGWVAHNQSTAPVTATLVERSGRFSWNWVAGITAGTYRLDVYRAMNNGTTPISGSTTIGFSSSQQGCARGIMEITGVPISNDGSSAIQAIASLAWTTPSGGSHATLTGVSAFAKPSNAMFAAVTYSLNANPTAESGYTAAATHPGYNTPASRLGMMWRATEETTPTFTWSGNGTYRAMIGLELVSYGTNLNATRFGALQGSPSRSQRYVRNAYETLANFFAVGRSITGGTVATYVRNALLRYTGAGAVELSSEGYAGVGDAFNQGGTNSNPQVSVIGVPSVSNCYMIVSVGNLQYSGPWVISGMEYAGTQMTRLGVSKPGGEPTQNWLNVETWGLSSPPAGTGTLYISYATTGGTSTPYFDGFRCWSIFSNVGQVSTVWGTTRYDPDTYVYATASVGDYVIDYVVHDASYALTQGAGQTTKWTQTYAVTSGVSFELGSSAGISTMSWTSSSGWRKWAHNAIAISPASAGGAQSFIVNRAQYWKRLLSVVRPYAETVSRNMWMRRSVTSGYSSAPATTVDDFNRAAPGSNWNFRYASLVMSGDNAKTYFDTNLIGDRVAWYNAWTGSDDMKAEGVFNWTGAGYFYIGPAVRVNDAATAYYGVYRSDYVADPNIYLFRFVGDTRTNLDTSSNFDPGSWGTMSLSAQDEGGTAVRLIVECAGSQIYNYLDTSANRLYGGVPGIAGINGERDDNNCDNLTVFDLAPGGASATYSVRRLAQRLRNAFVPEPTRSVGVGNTSTLAITAGTVGTWSHVIGTNETVIVGLMWDSASTPTSVTCDGTLGTQLVYHSAIGRKNAMFGFIRPTAGTATVIASFSGPKDSDYILGAVSLKNTHPTAPFGEVLSDFSSVSALRTSVGRVIQAQPGGVVCSVLSGYDPINTQTVSGGYGVWAKESSWMLGSCAIHGGGPNKYFGYDFNGLFQASMSGVAINPDGGQGLSASRVKNFVRTITNAISPFFSLVQEVIGGVGPTVRNAAFAIANSSIVQRSASYVRRNTSVLRGGDSVARLGFYVRRASVILAVQSLVSRVRVLVRNINRGAYLLSVPRRLATYRRQAGLVRGASSIVRRIGAYRRTVASAVSRAIAVGRSVSGGLTLRTISLLRASSETVSRRMWHIRRISIQRSLSSVLSRTSAIVRTLATSLVRSSTVSYRRWYIRTAARVGRVQAIAAYRRWLIRTVSTVRSIVARVGRSISGGLTLRSLTVLIPPSSRVSRIGRYIRRVSLAGSIRAVIDRSRRTARSMISGVRSTFSVRRLNWRVRNVSISRISLHSVRRVARYLRYVNVSGPVSYLASRVIGFTRFVRTQMSLSHAISQARITGELVLNFVSKTVPVNVFKATSAAIDNIRNVFAEINKFVSKR